MPILIFLYELCVAAGELLSESGILAGFVRYFCNTAFAWLATLVLILTGWGQWFAAKLAALLFGALPLTWSYAGTYFARFNAILPITEIAGELITVGTAYTLVIAMRWAKSVIPTESN